jgi:hypothetical protein
VRAADFPREPYTRPTDHRRPVLASRARAPPTRVGSLPSSLTVDVTGGAPSICVARVPTSCQLRDAPPNRSAEHVPSNACSSTSCFRSAASCAGVPGPSSAACVAHACRGCSHRDASAAVLRRFGPSAAAQSATGDASRSRAPDPPSPTTTPSGPSSPLGRSAGCETLPVKRRPSWPRRSSRRRRPSRSSRPTRSVGAAGATTRPERWRGSSRPAGTFSWSGCSSAALAGVSAVSAGQSAGRTFAGPSAQALPRGVSSSWTTSTRAARRRTRPPRHSVEPVRGGSRW